MKKIYNGFLNFLMKLPSKLNSAKTLFVEWYAIYRKRPLYKDIVWTKEQQKEFDKFWKQNYGRKISNRWHKLYQAGNGVFCVEYFPEMLYSTRYEPSVNDLNYCSVFSDKTLIDLFFNQKIENVKTPMFFAFNNHGRYYDSKRNIISENMAMEVLGNIGEAVIKPTVDSSSGRGVRILDMQGGVDKRTGETVAEILRKYKANFIVQERIEPCQELKTLYANAINTFRVISYVVNDSVEVAPVSLRIGSGGGEVDNIHAGGMSIGVNEDGILNKYAYRLGYGDSYEKYTIHPDTKVVFEGYKLSFVKELVAAAKRLHSMTANIGIISWDFTVNSKGEIVVVEVNLKGQSVWFPQILSGKALFGDDTAEVLEFLRK